MNTMENQEQAERQLVSRLIQGEPKAVAEFVEQYADDVYRFIYHQVGGISQDAEDIVQITLMAALKSIHRFRGDSKLRTWLFSIASHKVIDFQRRNSRRPKTIPYDATAPLRAGDLAPEQALEHFEDRQKIRQFLLQLPPHYRTALVLKYIEDMSVREICQVMERTEKSVESILVRARRSLAKIIESEEGDHD